MKKISLSITCLLVISITYAQQKAVTEKGEEVILYEDGTWKYQNEESQEEVEIPTNPTTFEKNKKATFLLKSDKINMGVWLNPKDWTFKKAINNPDAEYELKHKELDLYGMVISEKIEIPIETLKSIALENGKKASPDLKIVKEEYRMVNGLKVLCIQMNGTIQGIKFSYYGYYYSNAGGTIQFITYTSQSLLDSYRSKCDNLLNGLVEAE